jgi:hypothetical protein
MEGMLRGLNTKNKAMFLFWGMTSGLSIKSLASLKAL